MERFSAFWRSAACSSVTAGDAHLSLHGGIGRGCDGYALIMVRQIDRGPADVEFTFQNGDLLAPRGARHALQSVLGSAPFANDVTLAASELVTNVLMHTDNGGLLQAWGSNPIRLEVHDTSPGLPADAPSQTVGGRGLRIVGAVSSNWGTSATPDGKMVWAEFRRPLE